MEKENIVKDFGQKQKGYYRKNYSEATQQNYIRRLRNELIRERIESAPQKDIVLDVGCGPAILYPDLLNGCGKYYALDLVQTNLDEIRANNADADIEYLLSDLDSFSWEPGFFDLIICSGSVEYTESPEVNVIKLLRMLKPGGTLICSFPNLASPYRIWGEYVFKYLWLLKRKLTGKSTFSYPRKLFWKQDVCALIDDQPDIVSVENRYIGLRLLLQPLDNLFSGLDYKIYSSFEQNPNKLLDVLCQEFMLTIRR